MTPAALLVHGTSRSKMAFSCSDLMMARFMPRLEQCARACSHPNEPGSGCILDEKRKAPSAANGTESMIMLARESDRLWLQRAASS